MICYTLLFLIFKGELQKNNYKRKLQVNFLNRQISCMSIETNINLKFYARH